MSVTLTHLTVDGVVSLCSFIFRAFGWEWWGSGVPRHDDIRRTIEELTTHVRDSDKDCETGRILVKRGDGGDSQEIYEVYVSVGTVEVLKEGI